MRPRLIGVDWGTTRLRAALIGDGGVAIATSETGEGLRALGPGLFEPALARVVADWRAAHGALPILCSGMVGARTGWIEAPYAACPADAATLAAGVVFVDTASLGRVSFIPGVRQSDDVMRGEETQIFGALASGCADGLFVLPGTHSKWVRVRGQTIASFMTFMTGDVYAALKGHTILAATMTEGAGDDGFARGLDMARALDGPGALVARLFSLRVAALDGGLSPSQAANALSGLLIGAELRQMARESDGFTLVAGDTLAPRYETAAAAFGLTPRRAPGQCAAQGQYVLAHAAGLIGGAG